KAFQCVRALVDWVLVAQYRSHNELTIDMLNSYLKAFHKTKDIFRQYQSHFNFPKIHLMDHFTEHIRQYGNS
ncbi:hypothetical protein P167DRAFT_476132, partial [Morchella conica CCBAS932]